MSLLVDALSQGLIMSLLSLGVYLGFRLFGTPDLTNEGSFALGGAVAAVLLVSGWPPWAAIIAASLAGALAGTFSGMLVTRFQVTRILAGILTMTALYAINLRIMGQNVVPVDNKHSVMGQAEHVGQWLFGTASAMARDFSLLLMLAVLLAVVTVALLAFLRTGLGAAMRATGENAQMIRALGTDDRPMVLLGFALSNTLVALAGALYAQYLGFTDVQMGIGMVALGVASLIIGETLMGSTQLGYTFTGTILGSILVRIIAALALHWGLRRSDLKLITAGTLLAAFLLPRAIGSVRAKRRSAVHA